MFAGNIVNCRGYHDKTFKVFVTVLAVKFIDGHLATPVKYIVIKKGSISIIVPIVFIFSVFLSRCCFSFPANK